MKVISEKFERRIEQQAQSLSRICNDSVDAIRSKLKAAIEKRGNTWKSLKGAASHMRIECFSDAIKARVPILASALKVHEDTLRSYLISLLSHSHHNDEGRTLQEIFNRAEATVRRNFSTLSGRDTYDETVTSNTGSSRPKIIRTAGGGRRNIRSSRGMS